MTIRVTVRDLPGAELAGIDVSEEDAEPVSARVAAFYAEKRRAPVLAEDATGLVLAFGHWPPLKETA